jgi:FkbM family methyltransferase
MRAKIIGWFRRALGTKQILDRLDRIQTVSLAEESSSSSQVDSIAQGVRLAISNSDSVSYFKCELNGVPAWLPTDTLRTMINCVSVTDKNIDVQVETAHIKWMSDRLSKQNGKGLFVDVGSATGAASIPIALNLSNVRIVAFEPATNAMRLLRATIEKNNIHSVTLVNAAVSDVIGDVSFVEFERDPSGNCPWLPEASSIAHQELLQTGHSISATTVRSVTLDNYFSTDFPIDASEYKVVVVKIDVEGFEEQVLKGASDFIVKIQPYFSIDIHKKIDGDGTTEQICREILSRFGYTFKNMGHVLLASPQ